jgi:hypothetical protein
MPRRALAVLAALLIALAAAGAVAGGQVAAAASSPGAPDVAAYVSGNPPPTTPPAVTDNPFIPPDKNLSDCVSANPPPGCGSNAHGGWRQYLTFGIVILGLVFIGWRVVVIVRRNRKEQELESSGRR